MSRTTSLFSASLFAALSSAALSLVTGCDAQVDGGHQGEVLATIQGTLTTRGASPLEQAEVSVVWSRRSMMHGLVGAERVIAEGLFPHFKLSIYSPPPADMLDGFDVPADGRYGVGLIVVGTPETDYTSYQGWKGLDFAHVLVYLPDGAAAGSTIAGFLSGPTSPGFHIYDVRDPSEEVLQAWFQCVNDLYQRNNREPTQHEMYTQCPGTGRDVLTLSALDLETELEIEVVEDLSLVELIDSRPRW